MKSRGTSERPVDRIAAALLYEGYMLYPYRPSAVKNRQRFNFGVVGPAGEDACYTQTECLLRGEAATEITITARFLHLIDRVTRGESWQEAAERSVTVDCPNLGGLLAEPQATTFSWPASACAGDGVTRHQRAITGAVEVSATSCAADATRVRVRLTNQTEMSPELGSGRDERLLHSLVSAHTILTVTGGAFVSLLDPPDALRAEAAACDNIRTWPVMAGDPGCRDIMLSSPIIIYDYPALAPESAGDLFDATEIDEILSLRILTMTDEEQREMAHADERARLLLERTRSLGADDFMKMHGTMRPI
jgi:hypothetical protein